MTFLARSLGQEKICLLATTTGNYLLKPTVEALHHDHWEDPDDDRAITSYLKVWWRNETSSTRFTHYILALRSIHSALRLSLFLWDGLLGRKKSLLRDNVPRTALCYGTSPLNPTLFGSSTTTNHMMMIMSLGGIIRSTKTYTTSSANPGNSNILSNQYLIPLVPTSASRS